MVEERDEIEEEIIDGFRGFVLGFKNAKLVAIYNAALQLIGRKDEEIERLRDENIRLANLFILTNKESTTLTMIDNDTIDFTVNNLSYFKEKNIDKDLFLFKIQRDLREVKSYLEVYKINHRLDTVEDIRSARRVINNIIKKTLNEQ